VSRSRFRTSILFAAQCTTHRPRALHLPTRCSWSVHTPSSLERPTRQPCRQCPRLPLRHTTPHSEHSPSPRVPSPRQSIGLHVEPRHGTAAGLVVPSTADRARTEQRVQLARKQSPPFLFASDCAAFYHAVPERGHPEVVCASSQPSTLPPVQQQRRAAAAERRSE
jgi:hypothetical protein